MSTVVRERRTIFLVLCANIKSNRLFVCWGAHIVIIESLASSNDLTWKLSMGILFSLRCDAISLKCNYHILKISFFFFYIRMSFPRLKSFFDENCESYGKRREAGRNIAAVGDATRWDATQRQFPSEAHSWISYAIRWHSAAIVGPLDFHSRTFRRSFVSEARSQAVTRSFQKTRAGREERAARFLRVHWILPSACAAQRLGNVPSRESIDHRSPPRSNTPRILRYCTTTFLLIHPISYVVQYLLFYNLQRFLYIFFHSTF